MKHHGFRAMVRGAVLLLCALAGSDAWAQAAVYPKDGPLVRGISLRYRRAQQEYILTASGGTEMTFPRARISRVEVAKPAAYDAVVKMVNEGKFDAAIPVLEKMITDYEMLQWDNKARDLLGYAYTKQQDFKKAVATYEDLMKNALPSELTPELRRRYWDAMIGKGEYPALVKNLDELIAKGSREEAATAHLVRGDVYKAQGQTLDALFDYLRVAILYEQVKSVQPEALYKAARAMEDLRDPRAADMKKRLVQEYPRSEEAQKVQGTM